MARAAAKNRKQRTGERRKRTPGQRAAGSRAASARTAGASRKPRPAARGKKAAAKRVTARPARKAARPKAAVRKRATTKRAAAKRATSKPASKRRAAPKAAVRKRAAAKPRARRAAAHVPMAFAAQRAAADARGMLLFELARARAAVKAAVQGLSSARALQPIAPGKWSSFEIVLHLSERDRVRLEEFDRTLGGTPHSWAGMHDPEMRPVNEAHLAPLRAHTWDEAVRRLDSLREELLQRLAAVPAEPEHIWKPGHPFADMLGGLPGHDRHHAEQIKNARIGGTAPVEE